MNSVTKIIEYFYQSLRHRLVKIIATKNCLIRMCANSFISRHIIRLCRRQFRHIISMDHKYKMDNLFKEAKTLYIIRINGVSCQLIQDLKSPLKYSFSSRKTSHRISYYINTSLNIPPATSILTIFMHTSVYKATMKMFTNDGDGVYIIYKTAFNIIMDFQSCRLLMIASWVYV